MYYNFDFDLNLSNLSLILLIINIIIFLILCISCCIFVFNHRSFKKHFENNLKVIVNMINSVRYGNLSARIDFAGIKDYPQLKESINKMVETIEDREKMLNEFKNEIVDYNKFLEGMINSLSEGFIVADENFVIKKSTDIAEQFLGGDKIGQNIFDFIEILDKDLKVTELNNSEVFIKSSPNKSFLATLYKLETKSDAFRYLITIKDVTNEKEAEKIKQDFIATLTHDLKVPIIAESKAIKLLSSGKMGELSESAKELVNHLQNSNEELLELTQVLLDTYKLQDVGWTLDKTLNDMDELLKEVTNELKSISICNSQEIIFDLNIQEKFIFDKFQFKRVLKNLIYNSLIYSHSEKIKITSYKKDNSFYILITDYGKGISKEEQDKIFDKYYSSSKKFRKVGHGLGLYLANEIVKAHNGEITINSIENEQTDFIIKLPA